MNSVPRRRTTGNKLCAEASGDSRAPDEYNMVRL
ncbi:hypothetical protein CCACVL1_03801 [Corchorus capsularis]|uniref:Uncharacterized protein n=1 Tax=Corchorus capsularis TaxID=210143 RepID=A0A1R3JX93_COCAP|nr:hypothetical protein CCACVL1_03801 [Corchorus capsularis]